MARQEFNDVFWKCSNAPSQPYKLSKLMMRSVFPPSIGATCRIQARESCGEFLAGLFPQQQRERLDSGTGFLHVHKGHEARDLVTDSHDECDMILGLTIIAIAFAAFFLVRDEKDGTMSSYIWGLLGYAQEEVKREAVGAGIDSKSSEKQEPKGGSEANGQAAAKSPRGSEDEGNSTPKAKAREDRVLPPVPLFTLQAQEDADEDDEEDEDNLPPPSFPALNSAQRASAMPPPRMPTLNPPSSSAPRSNGHMAPPSRPGGLMPPPSRPVPSLRPSPPTNGLRVPTTGPLPNRNPTGTTSNSSSSLATPITAATSIPNPRKKVLLAPGHSPLDWANLKRTSANLSGVDRLLRVTPSMLKEKNGRKGRPAWSSYQGKVYNLSPYLPYHPGGEGELRRAAGKEGGKLFNEVHPWVNWENMLEGCLVGIMVSEGDGERESELDEMD